MGLMTINQMNLWDAFSLVVKRREYGFLNTKFRGALIELGHELNLLDVMPVDEQRYEMIRRLGRGVYEARVYDGSTVRYVVREQKPGGNVADEAEISGELKRHSDACVHVRSLIDPDTGKKISLSA